MSRATSEMDNHGRINLTLLDEALADNTPSAYNPFCAGIMPCNEEQLLTSVYRDNTTELMLLDFKMSNQIFSHYQQVMLGSSLDLKFDMNLMMIRETLI